MYKKILFAIDLLQEHNPLALKAVAIAQQFDATLYLLHVIELPVSLQLAQGLGFAEMANPAKEDAQAVLSLVGEHLGVPQTNQFIEIGSVKEHVFKKTEELSCELIIIGNQSHNKINSLLGSTAYSIVNHASCDVLTLRL